MCLQSSFSSRYLFFAVLSSNLKPRQDRLSYGTISFSIVRVLVVLPGFIMTGFGSKESNARVRLADHPSYYLGGRIGGGKEGNGCEYSV